MSAGQKEGTGAMTELDDAKVRKKDILSNRERSQRPADQSLESTGVQVSEYKDIPANQRSKNDKAETSSERVHKKVDRPGFDLGGSSGNTEAGSGLGLDDDAKEGRKGFALPRKGGVS